MRNPKRSASERRRSRVRTAAVGSCGALALATAVVATPSIAHASGGRAALAGATPSWATTANSTGLVSGKASLDVLVSLPLAAGAQSFALAVSNPKSASYGHYLTAAQFDARYAPTAKQVAAVSAWLRSSGFSVVSVPGNRRYVEATATAAVAAKAFGTTLHTYRFRGHDLYAPASAVSVPASIRSDVLAVSGLDDSDSLTAPDHVKPDAVSGASAAAKPATKRYTIPTPCSTYYGQNKSVFPAAYGKTKFPTYICGYTGPQLQAAYGVAAGDASGQDGTGVKVAIIDAYASPTIESDTDTAATAEGIPAFAPGQFTQVLPSGFNDQAKCGGAAGWNEEETLDVESSHEIAPGADIVYVAGKNCANGLFKAQNTVVSKDLAQIVSNSYSNNGENIPASSIAASEAVLIQGAAEGIGFNFSSGDDGDLLAVTGETQPSFEADDPMATSVGGTSLLIGKTGDYLGETGWGNDRAPIAYAKGGVPAGFGIAPPGVFYAGAGGGVSHVFAQPSYQQGVVPANLADEYGTAARVAPDVSALADPYTGFVVVQTEGGVLGSYSIGGTSLASPLFSGLEALASQGRSAPIGFANPLLYSLPGGAFHDVTPSTTPVALAFTSANPVSICYQSCLVTEDHDSSLQTAAGYDDVTGLGTPDGTAFIQAVQSTT